MQLGLQRWVLPGIRSGRLLHCLPERFHLSCRVQLYTLSRRHVCCQCQSLPVLPKWYICFHSWQQCLPFMHLVHC